MEPDNIITMEPDNTVLESGLELESEMTPLERIEAKLDRVLNAVEFIEQVQQAVGPAIEDMKQHPLQAMSLLTQLMRSR